MTDDRHLRASPTAPLVVAARPLVEAASVVSFDVFDTVLERPFARPTDLFAHMADEVAAELGVPAFDFREVRVEAEREARRRRPDLEDVTLDAIYDVVAERLRLDAIRARRVRELELDAERRALRARPLGSALYALARSLGKRVVFVSDMYLDAAFLKERLEAHGFEGERVFVSSEAKKTKASGALFDLVLEELGVEKHEVLHVGDNRRADVERAVERGLVAFHLPRVEESFERSAAALRLREHAGAHDVTLGAILTLGARGLAASDHGLPVDGSLFGGSAYRLGYLAFGPLLLGMSRWLLRRAMDEKIETLHFLARDGRVLVAAYERLVRSVEGAPRATYLLSSRRAALVASLRTATDVIARVRHGFGSTTVAELLEGKFGFDAATIADDVWTTHGLSSDTLLRPKHREPMLALLGTLAPRILDGAAKEREAYVRYLASIGCHGSRAEAVVDIGYAGTMQVAIDTLTGGRAELGGFYVVTLDTAKADVADAGMRIDGYLGSFVDRAQMLHPFFRRVPMYETLFSSDATSLVKMRLEGDVPVPVFAAPVENESRRIEVVLEIQRGALDFVEHHADPAALPVEIDAERALAILDAFLERPDAVDAAIFRGIPFENAFGAARVLPILPDVGAPLDGACLWEEGRQALVHGDGPRTASLPERLLAEAIFRAVNALAPRLLAGSKAMKLRYDPARFFSDSRSPFVRRIGRLYLSVPSRR